MRRIRVLAIACGLACATWSAHSPPLGVQAAAPGEYGVRALVMARSRAWFGPGYEWAVDYIVWRESRWSLYAVNPWSGACGLWQSWPCQKMGCVLSDALCQAEWGLRYIRIRYGNPAAAALWWQRHGWY
jgi:hypothetical protein